MPYRKPSDNIPKVPLNTRISQNTRSRMEAFATSNKLTMQRATEVLLEAALGMAERGQLKEI